MLYCLPQVLAATCVLVMEGEKDVDAAYCIGLPEGWAATTTSMGAGKWRPEMCKPWRASGWSFFLITMNQVGSMRRTSPNR